jgi:hypothetical protein
MNSGMAWKISRTVPVTDERGRPLALEKILPRFQRGRLKALIIGGDVVAEQAPWLMEDDHGFSSVVDFFDDEEQEEGGDEPEDEPDAPAVGNTRLLLPVAHIGGVIEVFDCLPGEQAPPGRLRRLLQKLINR